MDGVRRPQSLLLQRRVERVGGTLRYAESSLTLTGQDTLVLSHYRERYGPAGADWEEQRYTVPLAGLIDWVMAFADQATAMSAQPPALMKSTKARSGAGR